ncbi:helix-turn-helix domain-containing protein [Rhizobium sp. GR12]|uniref:helix-turn-helix domain-containing protein n=1 Tax=Rhizobium sp. GR12 TaxID=3053925 RepID=UPI002FBEB976
MAAANAKGKVPGRRPALTEVQCREIRTMLNAGASVREIAQKYNVHPRTVLRGIRRLS